MTDCLKDFFDCEARHVGGPGDRGIDIVLIISDKPLIVQVKRRSSPNSIESVKVVRELLETLLSENFCHGVVVNTAKRFSKEAVRLVELPVIVNKGYTIELYDYSAVFEIIGRSSKINYQPWDDLWT